MRNRNICPVCKRPKKRQFPYCLNCHKKLCGRPAPKQFGECKYGRCHLPVARGFLGLPEEFCPQHQSQKNRGMI